MEVDYAFLANAAEANNGVFHVLGGGIDTVRSPKIPVNYPKLSLVLRVVFEPAELGRKHRLEIQVMDEDGNKISAVGADLTLDQKNPNLPKGWRQGIMTIVPFAQLVFPRFSDYAFHIIINNSSLKSIPFRVVQHVQVNQ